MLIMLGYVISLFQSVVAFLLDSVTCLAAY